MKDAINWFEIPVNDFERAKNFYDTLLNSKIEEMPFPEGKYGVFKYDREQKGVGGAIVKMQGAVPSAEGTTVYLPGGDDLSSPLGRVESAGGKIVMPKTSIGENGFMALFMDTEGNKIALHSMN